jgi:hypothetical protein
VERSLARRLGCFGCSGGFDRGIQTAIAQ